MSEQSEQEAHSLSLDHYMDTIGFAPEDVEQRQLYQNTCSYARNISNKIALNKGYIDKVVVGSKREGTSLTKMGDTDAMQIDNSVYCMSDIKYGVISTQSRYRGRNIFQVIREGVKDGYCKLKLYPLHAFEEFNHALKYGLQLYHGETYLSSLKYIEKNEDFNCNSTTDIGRRTEYHQTRGPSIPKVVKANGVTDPHWSDPSFQQEHIDFVKALPCDCPDIIRRFRVRERKYDWPSRVLVHQVANLPGHVVPVGPKDSANSDLQWRICYTLAEVRLMQSFNNTQTKVYAVLKYITKSLLPENDVVTSYFLKNLMFWMCENTDSRNFTPSLLLERVRQALAMLRDCLQERRLSSYMIPERNLYIHTVHSYEIVDKVSEILRQGQLGWLCEQTISQTIDTDVVRKCLLVERINELKVQMFNIDDLISVFASFLNCESSWSVWLTEVWVNGKYLQTYGWKGVNKPFDVPRKTLEERSDVLWLKDIVDEKEANLSIRSRNITQLLLTKASTAAYSAMYQIRTSIDRFTHGNRRQELNMLQSPVYTSGSIREDPIKSAIRRLTDLL